MININQVKEYLNYSDETQLYKFMAPLLVCEEEDIKKISELLLEKGIIKLNKDEEVIAPANLKIFADGYDFIENQIKEYEAIDEINALKEKGKLWRITSKKGPANLKTMKTLGEPYKDGEKYSDIPFRDSVFMSKYGNYNPEEDIYDEILNQNEVTGMDMDEFDKYDELLDHAKQINIYLYGNEELDEKIKDLLIKLTKVGQDRSSRELLFTAFTLGRNISSEQEVLIKNIIDVELNHTSALNLEMGGRAA